jgi:hypothetical protein
MYVMGKVVGLPKLPIVYTRFVQNVCRENNAKMLPKSNSHTMESKRRMNTYL